MIAGRPQLAWPDWLGFALTVGTVSGIGIADRRIEGDDQNALGTRVLKGRDDRIVRCGDQDALGTRSDAVLDGFDLRASVTIDLAGEGLEFEAEFLSLGFCLPGFGLSSFCLCLSFCLLVSHHFLLHFRLHFLL